MKKLLAIAVLALAAIPAAGLAGDIDNANECKAKGDGAHIRSGLADGGQEDRGSGCINAGGVQVLYIGGEISPENSGNAGSPCGAIVVADDEITPDGDKDFNDTTCN